MNTLGLVLLVLLLLGAFGGWHYGGPHIGGGIGLVLLIVLIIVLAGGRI